jgi:hypothetical protein
VVVLIAVAFVISMAVVIAYRTVPPIQRVVLSVGQVAPEDIRAPRSTTYPSEVLTLLAQQAAENAVRPVYDPPDRTVLREQVQLARHTLDYVGNVRGDSYATPAQRLSDLGALVTVKADADTFQALLELSEVDWATLDAQVMQLLERTMRGDIRDDTLPEVYANLPNLVSVTIDEPQATLIVTFARSLIRPNSFYNEERTREARARAKAAVETEMRSFVQGQTVVRAGQVVTAADVEALEELGLLQRTDDGLQVAISALLLVTLLTTITLTYMQRFYDDLFENVREMLLIGGLLLVFVAGARMVGNGDAFQAHLYPAAAFALVVASFANPQITVVLTVVLASLIGVVMGNSLELALLIAVGGMVGVLVLRRVERLNAYFAAGLTIGLTNIGLSLVFLLANGNSDPTQVLSLSVAGLLNGLLSAGLGLTGLYVSSNVLNLPTSLRLLELSQPGQPLLQRLLREAPGTYQHSLQVANLAEQAAERIGANATLVRVAALYHDIGKMVASHYFVENQTEGMNPHDQVKDPIRSAQIIISHVTEGEKLARKYHLPKDIIDFILQHHGTLPVLYFYNKALEAVDCDESKVDKSRFTYPGPTPQTREAGILMLADTCESVVRAKRPRNKGETEEIVNEIFHNRLHDAQLISSHLTLNDLNAIREVFVSTLQGIFHPRIVYPTPTRTQEMKAVQLPSGPVASLATPSSPALPPPNATPRIVINADDFE